MKYPLSVLILTRNEELNIEACLGSVAWADEVFVVDSLSDDRTIDLAKRLGATVFSHSFEGYAKQRNWALDNLPFSHEWVLVLDADEQIPADLANEISRTLDTRPNTFQGYYLKRKFFFLGRWLKHGGLYPTWILRLFHRQGGRFEERPMNEHVVLNGTAGRLEEAFDHFDRRPLSNWIAKHNRYADLEAEEYWQEKYGGGYRHSLVARFWGTQAERKRWIKLHIWNRLPVLLRPFLFFLRNYILKGGFLDGKPGFIYHTLWSFWYPFLISAKILERQKASQLRPPEQSPVPEGEEESCLAPVASQVGAVRRAPEIR